MKKTVNNLLAIARAELGYHEKDSSSDLDSKTAGNDGSGNYTKYARDLADAGYYQSSKQGYAWCDVFVDWCFYQLAGKDPDAAQKMICQTGPYGAGCEYSSKYYMDQNRFFTADPQAGDQIFFGDFDHTGIVEWVADGVIHTIEGNTQNHVGQQSYEVGDSYIAGFGRPYYEEESAVAVQAIKDGDVVSIKPGARFWGGETVDGWLMKKEWIVYGNPSGKRAVINQSVDGKNQIMSPISIDYLEKKTAVQDVIVPDLLYNQADQLPPSARKLVEKLLNKDYLVGTPNGLELTGQMVRILMILDRAGAFD